MKNAIKKMLIRDISVVVGFVVFLWATMCFILFSILGAAGASQTKCIIVAIGVVGLLFATLSLLALILHLQKNRDQVYTEELLHSKVDSESIPHGAPAEEIPRSTDDPRKISHGFFVKAFDIMFIMVLCFVTLLAAMLLRGKTVNGAHIYSVGIVSVAVTVVGFTVYFVNVLANSNRELKMMVEEIYPEEAEAESTPQRSKQ